MKEKDPMNPLKTAKMTAWFKKQGKAAHHRYTSSFQEKK